MGREGAHSAGRAAVRLVRSTTSMKSLAGRNCKNLRNSHNITCRESWQMKWRSCTRSRAGTSRSWWTTTAAFGPGLLWARAVSMYNTASITLPGYHWFASNSGKQARAGSEEGASSVRDVPPRHQEARHREHRCRDARSDASRDRYDVASSDARMVRSGMRFSRVSPAAAPCTGTATHIRTGTPAYTDRSSGTKPW